jgi:hypothetical protein
MRPPVITPLPGGMAVHVQAEAVEVDLLLLKDGSQAVVVVEFDPCARPQPNATPTQTPRRDAACSWSRPRPRWGWVPQDPGKAVFALSAKEG